VNNIIIILQKQQTTGGIDQQGKQLAGTKGEESQHSDCKTHHINATINGQHQPTSRFLVC